MYYDKLSIKLCKLSLMNTLGHNLKTIRTEKQMTQSELAKRLDTSQQYISKLENGRVNMSADFLIALIAALDTTYEAITEGIVPNR